MVDALVQVGLRDPVLALLPDLLVVVVFAGKPVEETFEVGLEIARAGCRRRMGEKERAAEDRGAVETTQWYSSPPDTFMLSAEM